MEQQFGMGRHPFSREGMGVKERIGYVAEIDGKGVGFASMQGSMIWALYIHPEYQNECWLQTFEAFGVKDGRKGMRSFGKVAAAGWLLL